MPDYEDQAAAAERIAQKTYALLVGHPSEIQGAVLADLLATWLAGHIVHDNPAETHKIRKSVLDLHIEVVRKLIPVNATLIHARADGI